MLILVTNLLYGKMEDDERINEMIIRRWLNAQVIDAAGPLAIAELISGVEDFALDLILAKAREPPLTPREIVRARVLSREPGFGTTMDEILHDTELRHQTVSSALLSLVNDKEIFHNKTVNAYFYKK